MYLFLLPALLWGSPTADPYSEINENWDRFGAVYGRILDYYFPPDYLEKQREPDRRLPPPSQIELAERLWPGVNLPLLLPDPIRCPPAI